MELKKAILNIIPRKTGRFAFIIFTICILLATLADAKSARNVINESASFYGDSLLHLGETGFVTRADTATLDLDYSKDFSIEGIVNIFPNSAGGRWSSLLSKASGMPDASSGFGLGIDQGQFEFLGQQIYARVADGTNIASLSSKPYQGLTDAIAVWNSGAKTLTLYVNGVSVGISTNALINLAGIKNTHDLQMGPNLCYGCDTLQRDILLARLWNRALTALEVANLWQNFSQTQRHTLPAGFDTTALVSEWLMAGTSDAGGNPGTTHVKDNVGSNHLQMLGGANLLNAPGILTLVYPADGATGVSAAVVLVASGGINSLSGAYTPPLQYDFQIDETINFNSLNLIDSGWVSHYGLFQPNLNSGKQYNWRVKVRDSAATPLESTFSSAHTFSTAGSRDWVVRPGTYTGTFDDKITPIAVQGTYGREDGTSYENAWNGIRNIIWGANGVKAGDNLYVCGTHLYQTASGNFLNQQAREAIPESGSSADNPITIRMDCPQDPGVMWGYCDLSAITPWSGPDSNGVYWVQTNSFPPIQDIHQKNGILLDKESSASWVGHPGAWYHDGTNLYVKTTDGTNPAGRIYIPNGGYNFDLGRSSYIKFYKCNFYGAPVARDTLLSSSSTLPLSHHIVYDSCELKYGTPITLEKGHDYWTVKNCEISFAPYGIYSSLNKYLGAGNDIGPNYLTVDHNRIHDIGGPEFPDNDEHALGVQGGDGYLIQYNQIWNTGSAIEFWTDFQPMKNMTVRYNYIHDIHVSTVTGGGGITVSGNESAPGLETGYKIYGNIIMNTGLNATESWQGYGIGSNDLDPVEVYNNIIVNTRGGINFIVNHGPPQGSIYNNIIVNPKENYYYMDVVGTTQSAPNVTVDSNLYSPIKSTATHFILYPSMDHDLHSLFADPIFASSPPLTLCDFELSANSPAWKLGFQRIPIELFGCPQAAGAGAVGKGLINPAPQAFTFPNPSQSNRVTLRSTLGDVDSLDITIYDQSGRVAHSQSLPAAAAGTTADGYKYYDYAWNDSKASGVYVAVVNGKKSDGSKVSAKCKFAVVK